MCFTSLNKEKDTQMYCLSVYLIQIQSYRAFSKMAVDHWCLSLSGRDTKWHNVCHLVAIYRVEPFSMPIQKKNGS